MPCNVSVRGAFQLTPSARRATGNHLICVMLTHISTHALHGESDKLAGKPVMVLAVFQSTPSARRATDGIRAALAVMAISIHALRGESDPQYGWTSSEP